MSLVAFTDFVGKYELSINEENEPKIQLYIDRLENLLLNELFGVDLFTLWDGSANPIYTTLTTPFMFQDENCMGKIWESKGIVDMLTGFIYWEYSKDAYTQQTIDGAQKNTGENSLNSTFIMANLQGRYADALNTYEAIQAYIKKGSDVYPEFKEVQKHIVIPFF